MTTVRNLALALTAATLAACGGSDSSTPTPTPTPETITLTGTVATGAPLVGVTINVRCGNTFQTTTSTGSGGFYSVQVPEGITPCILRATGGTPFVALFSLATAPGRTNITPLTTLATGHAMMIATGETSFNVFFAQGSIDLPPLAAELATSTTMLLDEMVAAGYIPPANFDPFRSAFAAIPGDSYDDLLEALAAALAEDDDTLSTFFSAWLGGAPIPPAPDGFGQTPVDPDIIGTLAGSYDVEFVHVGLHARGTVVIGADNSVDFDTDVSFSAADADAADVFDRIDCCNRIDVNYGEDGYLRLYLSEGGELRDARLEIDSEAVALSFLEPLEESDSDGSLLEGNGVIGTVDSVLYTQEAQEEPPFLVSQDGVFTLASSGVTPVWLISRVPNEVGVHYCMPVDDTIYIEFIPAPQGHAGGSVGRVGRCTVSVDSITVDASGNTTAVEGRFAVELLTKPSVSGTAGNDVAIVTDGYFRYEP